MAQKVEVWRQHSITDGRGKIVERFVRWLELLIGAVNGLYEGKQPLIVAEADAAHAITNEDIVNCAGNFTVTLPAINNAMKAHTITSTSGTITIAGDATIQAPASVTIGNSVTVYPARGQWWHR